MQIDTKVEDLPDNRVRVNINIKEGNRAKIRQINIVGNTRFRDKEILDTLSLQTPNWNPGTSRAIAIRANRCRAISKKSRPTTRTAAMPISTSSRRKSRSPRTRATSSSP